jgi:hypothetical protein
MDQLSQGIVNNAFCVLHLDVAATGAGYRDGVGGDGWTAPRAGAVYAKINRRTRFKFFATLPRRRRQAPAPRAVRADSRASADVAGGKKAAAR